MSNRYLRSLPNGRLGARAFGAAMAVTALADSPAPGAILPLVASPAVNTIHSTGTGGATIDLFNVTTGGPGEFFQRNDGGGRTLLLGTGGFQWRGPVGISSPITIGQAFSVPFFIPYFASGISTFAFQTPGNQVGWVRMQFFGVGGDIVYLAAAWNNAPGGNILAGTLSPVPEPTSAVLTALASLAGGAHFIRRRRKAIAS